VPSRSSPDILTTGNDMNNRAMAFPSPRLIGQIRPKTRIAIEIVRAGNNKISTIKYLRLRSSELLPKSPRAR